MIRFEQDSIGVREVPSYAYYGIQTLRAGEMFPIASTPVHKEFIIALACVKKAAAQAHLDIGTLPIRIGSLLVKAAEEVIQGRHLEHFKVDFIQGSINDSLNMNMNEVLANRVLELMLADKGDYALVNPSFHINLGQTTNEVISTALRIASYQLSQKLTGTAEQLITALLAAAKQPSKPHHQSKEPQTKTGTKEWLMGQFEEAALSLQQDLDKLAKAASHVQAVRLSDAGANSGTELSHEFSNKAVAYLSKLTQIPLTVSQADKESPQDTDVFVQLSSALKLCALTLTKLCRSVRTVAASSQADRGDWDQPPGVQPEKAEALSQIAFQVIGFDHSIKLASEAGIIDRGAVQPIVAYNLIESLIILSRGMESFAQPLTFEEKSDIPAHLRG
ncbi:lyase family protein [Paenibacillus sp. J22TS3]|uniref:lyase family protein n=1 Tax=Paenibacillus sp. J22TS3 TaxID=2807192 RepID=UPI001B138339|nr:lyase family protein [Paenibacillus sp. J22TS3]GIP21141.1 aspartate ammonia-lyase [Paenibacillus sp. J22TS3]